MINRFLPGLILLFFFNIGYAQQFFHRTDESKIHLRSTDERTIIPEKYDVYSLDMQAMKGYLQDAPMEFLAKQGLKVQIPVSDGTFMWFEVFESPVMESEIAARYPSIKSYKAYGVHDRSLNMRMALSPQGFYAAINTLEGEIYIDPYSEENILDYIVYKTADVKTELLPNVPLCGVEHEPRPDFNGIQHTINRTDNVVIREYRLAMACTGEWGSARRRGTVETCLADINTMINRLNSIFEREVAVRFKIINNNDKLIFLDPNRDPYEDAAEGGKIVFRNTEILNKLLPQGADEYDTGHVLAVCFDVGGVVAGGACNTSNKGNGVTCNTNNDLTGGVINIMAHEVGHQFDASHTWNRCPGIEGQRAGNWAYEPGSGSTILSYSGACGNDNVPGGKDEYYHVGSLIQMFAKTTPGGVAYNCATKIPTDNHQPVAHVPAEKYTIPISTPFFLTGSGEDEDGDALTYCWEQFDLGPSIPLGTSDNPEGPIFRSYKPEKNANLRFFPKPASILTGQISEKTEPMPTVARTLNFKFTVRDNNPVSEGVVWKDYSLEVTDKAGPFKLTYPETAQQFKVGQLITVKWDVANTDKAPVNCKKVNIYASYNAAIRDDDPNLIPLALGVDNNGAYIIRIPEKTTNLLRIIVKAADHIILTSSAAPSKVVAATEPEVYAAADAGSIYICQPDIAQINYQTTGLGGFEGDLRFTVVEDSLPKGMKATFNSELVKAGDNNLLVLNTDHVIGYQTGKVVVLAVANGLDTIIMTTDVVIEGGDINHIQTIAPVNGSSGITGAIRFNWNSKPDAVQYEIEIANNPDFSDPFIFEKLITQDTFYRIKNLVDKATIYYWRVRAYNNCKSGEWSEVQAFITDAQSCIVYKSGLQNELISTAANAKAEIKLDIAESGIVSDLNISLIKATHSRLQDISAYLVSPSGKEATLWHNQCGNQQNINVRLDDQSPDFFQCPINTGKLYRTDVAKGADKLSFFNDEQMHGTWTLRLEDSFSGSGGRFQEFNMEICANIQVQSPYLVTNKRLEIHPGDQLNITQNLLESLDNDNTAAELIYRIVKLPAYGAIRYNGLPVKVGDTFTQEDLNNDRVRYVADADYEGETYFSFTVTDGNAGWIGITHFEILIDQSIPVKSNDIISGKDVYVYPNPVSEQLNVVVNGSAAMLKNYIVTDLSGRIVLKGDLSGVLTKINIQSLDQGIYILKLMNHNVSISKKIVRM